MKFYNKYALYSCFNQLYTEVFCFIEIGSIKASQVMFLHKFKYLSQHDWNIIDQDVKSNKKSSLVKIVINNINCIMEINRQSRVMTMLLKS